MQIDFLLLSNRAIKILYLVFFFIALSDLVMLLSRKAKDTQKKIEIHTKVKSWWIIYGIVFLSLNLPVFYFSFCLTLLSLFGKRELFFLVEKKTKDKAIMYLLTFSTFLYQFFSYRFKIETVSLVTIYLLLMLLPFVLIFKGRTSDFMSLIGRYFLSFYLVVIKIGYLSVFLSDPFFGKNGRNLLVYLIILTCFSDVFQFIFGNLIKGKKIIPAISPEKTWSGFLFGILFTVLLGIWFGPYLTSMGIAHCFISSFLISFFGFAGDIMFSAIKREHGVKDYGVMIPGHGGLLDRLNSLTYSAPTFYIFLKLMYT